MGVSVTDFESGLHRARAIMHVANVTGNNRKLAQPDRHRMHGLGVIPTAVNRQVVRTVHGGIGGHPDSNAQVVEHFFRRGQLVHLRSVEQFKDFRTAFVVETKRISDVARHEHGEVPQRQWKTPERVVGQRDGFGDGFGHRLASFVSRWPTRENRSRRLREPRPDVANASLGFDRTERGPHTQILEGFHDHIGALVTVPFSPGVSHPDYRGDIRIVGVTNVFPDSEGGSVDRNNGNPKFAHRSRLAEHDPATEVACPHCGQRFLDNGWTGYTPIQQAQYGERTWVCPQCGGDMKEVRNRPIRTARKFAGSSGDLSQRLTHSFDPTICPNCGGPMSEPQPVRAWSELSETGTRWVNHCLNCGSSHVVNPKAPLLKQHQQDLSLTAYPEILQQVDPGRAWVTGKMAEVAPQHRLWFKPTGQEWGRGLLHEPTGTVRTWPESEATHGQRIQDSQLAPQDFVRFAIRPDGRVDIPPLFADQVHQADPRLTAPTLFGHGDVLASSIGLWDTS